MCVHMKARNMNLFTGKVYVSELFRLQITMYKRKQLLQCFCHYFTCGLFRTSLEKCFFFNRHDMNTFVSDVCELK